MKVKWSLAELQKNQHGIYPVSGQADLTAALKSRRTDILDASLIDIQGAITVDGKKKFYVDITLDLNLTLPSSRSLEPVKLDLHIPFNEVYLAPDVKITDLEDTDEEVFALELDILDLQKPIEDTILATIPMKVLTKEEESATDLPTGKDWQLVLEDDVDTVSKEKASAESKSSPFDILKDLDLFNDEDEEN
jgi:uncharacterized protein